MISLYKFIEKYNFFGGENYKKNLISDKILIKIIKHFLVGNFMKNIEFRGIHQKIIIFNKFSGKIDKILCGKKVPNMWIFLWTATYIG